MTRNEPLGTARDANTKKLRAVTLTPSVDDRASDAMPGHVARLQAAVLERATRDRDRAARAEVTAAIARAERGDELSLLDLDLDDPAKRGRALSDVFEERARRDRAAAAMITVARLRRRIPDDYA